VLQALSLFRQEQAINGKAMSMLRPFVSPRFATRRSTAPVALAAGALVGVLTIAPASADPAPTLLWERYPGSVEEDYGEAVAIDTVGNILVGGQTLGSIGRRDNQGYDAFVIKYSPEGEILWRRQPGPARYERLLGIATDLADDVVAVGETTGAIAGANRGMVDGFVVKYATDATVQWKRQFGATYVDSAEAVATDPAGNIIVAGSVGLHGTCCETGDAIVIKYAPDGTELWRRTFDLSGMDEATGVATDTAGDVFVAGDTVSSELDNYGAQDTFIARLSPDGTLRWIEQQATSGDEDAHGIAVDETGTIFIVGTQIGPNEPYTEGFLAAFAGDGAQLWRRGVGGDTSYDDAYGVAIDADGHVLMTGAEGYQSFVASYSRAGAPRWKILASRFDRGGYAFVAADGTGHMAVVGTADVRAAAGHKNAHVARYEVE
jgi:hypothetical protein